MYERIGGEIVGLRAFKMWNRRHRYSSLHTVPIYVVTCEAFRFGIRAVTCDDSFTVHIGRKRNGASNCFPILHISCTWAARRGVRTRNLEGCFTDTGCGGKPGRKDETCGAGETSGGEEAGCEKDSGRKEARSTTRYCGKGGDKARRGRVRCHH